MRNENTKGRARALAAPLALAALALAALLPPPSSLAARRQDGRPRRVETPARPTPTPARQQPGTTPAQTPTPSPTPPQAVPPRLQTQPVATPDEPRAQDGSGEEVDEGEVVRINTNEIKLHVRVVDRYNRPVSDVKQSDFRVFENNVPQTVVAFTKEEVPISYGVVVDNSGSLRSQINQVIEAAKSIVESNKPGDETFVVRFVSSEEIKIMQDFTSDKQAVMDALEDMYVEGGQTAIIDAVYLSAEHASERKKGNPLEDKRRRAVIVITDGEDRSSFYKKDQLFDALKEQDVQIYVIGFVNELERERGFISKSRRDKAVDFIDRLTRETGGRAFYPTSLSELPQIAEEITKDLRTQYVLSYVPTNPARPGEFRPVRVAVADAPGREKRIAVTRSGYTARGAAAPAGGQQPAANGQTTPAAKKP